MKSLEILYDMLPDGAQDNAPKKIIVHSMGEFINNKGVIYGARDWLKYLGYSAHILVTPSGTLIRCRTDFEGAYHARGHNTASLGIEFLVQGEHDYGTFLKAIKKDWVTEAQMEMGAIKIREWMDKFHILSGEVRRHSDISPGRKVDPGNMDWDKLLTLIGKTDDDT